MRVYVAGPMTGILDNNKPAFALAWTRLHEAGFEAISPHFLESVMEVKTREAMGTAAVYRHVLPVDIFALSSVEAVLALPNWQGSRGAKLEKHFADLIEIPWVSSFLLSHSIERYIDLCIVKLNEHKEAAIANPIRS